MMGGYGTTTTKGGLNMLTDDRYCLECVNCKYKDTYGEGHKLYQCGKHRAAITERTRPSWVIGCKGQIYQRRGNE